jgi:hypothetical protein
MPARDHSYEVLEALGDAAREIAELAGPDNEVCRRLHDLLGQLRPQSVTVGELAGRIDVAPHDVLEAALAIGVSPFWHDGQQFRKPAYLQTYLRQELPYDPVPELEFDLTPEMARLLSEKLSVSTAELLPETNAAGQRGPRKFVRSQTSLSDHEQSSQRRDLLG